MSKQTGLHENWAKLTGESLTEAIVVALKERLARLSSLADSSLVEDVLRIGRRNAARQILDLRSSEEILGYGPDGLPS
jgi:antitoxin VapB